MDTLWTRVAIGGSGDVALDRGEDVAVRRGVLGPHPARPVATRLGGDRAGIPGGECDREDRVREECELDHRDQHREEQREDERELHERLTTLAESCAAQPRAAGTRNRRAARRVHRGTLGKVVSVTRTRLPTGAQPFHHQICGAVRVVEEYFTAASPPHRLLAHPSRHLYASRYIDLPCATK